MSHTQLVVAHSTQARSTQAKAGNRARLALMMGTMMPVVALLGLSSATYAQSLPTGGQVVSGQATIVPAGGSDVVVSQASDKAIINWNTFSIGQGGTVQFNNGQGATLNRVTGGQVSSIDGLLSATGSVYLINPNGVIVGKSGVINTGGTFVASTLDLSDNNFLKGGDLTFDGSSLASVLNLGQIGALGGDVSLIAAQVKNDGTITAGQGTVGLIAGHSVLMRDTAVDDGKFLVLKGGSDTSVTNTGALQAAAAELRAEGGNVYALAGNTEGVINASGVSSHDGKVFLTAGDTGSVTIAGTTVSATDADGNGGDISVTGKTIAVAADATLDASASTDGAASLRAISRAAGSTSAANSGSASTPAARKGGTVKVVANSGDGSLSFKGAAKATGTAGDGGVVETSGASVDFTGARVDTSSAGGKTGNWLTDPYDLTVDSAAASTIAGNLATTNVTLQTTASGTTGPGTANASGTGDITVNADISWSSANTLTLDAYHGININANLTVAGAGGVVLTTNHGGTGGDYSFGAAKSLSYTATGGTLTINGSPYTLLYSMADVATMNAQNGLYALAKSQTSTGTYTDDVVATFGGTFTGLGNTISNLTINGTGGGLTGFFGQSTGTIRDIALVGGSVTSGTNSNNTGALVGLNNGGTILNSSSTATVDGGNGNQAAGGLVGYSQNGIIKNSHTGGAVAGYYATGGLVGSSNNDTISNSYATGAVTNGGQRGGGLIGIANASVISNVYATGNVSGAGSDEAGGLIGVLNMSSTLDNGYATGSVSGNQYVGGLIGALSASTTTTNSYATGAVTGNFSVGGFVGWASSGTISRSFATGSVTDNTFGADSVGGFIGNANGTVINDAYATGSVTGQGSSNGFGGFAGELNSGSSLTDVYATGMLSVNNSGNVGGLAGFSAGTITNGYYDYQTTGQAAGVQADGSQGLSTAALQGALPTGFSSSVWGTAPGFYPYLFVHAPTQMISGFGYLANGSAASGASVGVYSGGNLLGGTSATTGANGYYYVTTYAGTVGATTKLGAALTLSGDTSASGLTYTDTPTMSGGDVTGLNITSGTLKANTTATAQSTLLANMTTAFGSGNFTSLMGGLSAATTLNITAATSFTIDQSLGAAGKVMVQANNGDLTINSGSTVSTTASGDAIILAANGSFINHEGAGAVSATNGRWLIYSQAHNAATSAPTGDVTGSLAGTSYYGDTYNFTTSAFATTPGSGNRFVHGYQPTLTVTPDTKTVTYNGAAQADSYGATGYLSGDSAVGDLTGTLTGATTGSRNVGLYSLTATGGLTSGMNYAINYGTGALTIAKATLTLGAVTDTKTYDRTNSSTGTVSVSGLQSGDTLLGATQTFDSVNAGSRTLSVSGYTLTDGNSGGNYNVVTNTAAGSIGKATLTLGAVTDTKTYNGSAASTGTVSVSGLVAGDSLTGVTQSFDSKNAGTRTLSVSSYTLSDGNAGGNYNVVTNTAAGSIGKATLTLGAVADTKTYDRTNTSTGTVGVSGLQSGDTLTGATQTFDSVNAGSRTLSVSSYTLSDGNSGGNYNVVTNTAAGTINKASLTLTAVTDAKTYDGTTASTATVGTTGLLLGDTVTASQSFDSKNAGSRTLSVDSGYTVNDGNSGGNYSVTTSTAAGSIAKASLTLAAVADTKTYDTTSNSTGTVGISGLQSGDTLTGATQSFDSKNAGSRTLSVTGYTLTDGNAGGNYNVVTTTAAGTINKAALTAALIGTTSKTYDGTTTAALASGNYSLTGVLGGDDVSLNDPTSGTYADKNAGSGKSVSATGLALSGGDALNYTVNGTASANIGSIDKATLTLAAVTDTKTYDRTNSSTGTVGVSGLMTGDTLTAAMQTFDSVNAGNRTLSVSAYTLTDGNNGGNYTVNTTTASGLINKAALTLAAVTDSRTYDGTSTSTVAVSNSGLFTGDTVSATQSFDSRNAGTRTLSVNSGYTVNDGNNGGNYDVTTTTASGSIAKASLTITAATDTKTYDGTMTSTVTPTAAGLMTGDTVTGLSESFDSKNAGARTLTVNGTYIINDGNGGNNYTVATGALTAVGTINKAALTAALIGTSTKTYDGTQTATLASGNYTLTGAITGDVVALNNPTSGIYADKNAGTGKSVSVSGLALSGTDAGNYTVNTSAMGNIGTINKADLTLTATTATKTYDGITTTTATPTMTGLQTGDSVTGAAEVYDSKNAGNRTLSVYGYTVNDGNNGGNYNVHTVTVAGIINKAALTLAATTGTKTYDGTVTSTATANVSGLVSGSDTVTGVSEVYDSKNAGGRTLSIGGYTINDGNNGGNYAVTTTTAAGTINKAALTAALIGTSTKTYDGTQTATLASGNYILTGAITGDVVALNNPTSGTYADKNAGTGKSVSVSGLALSGTDAGNYTVNTSAMGNIGTINKAALTVALTGATTKTYDATTTATLTAANYTVTGKVTGDTVTLNNPTAGAYADKNAGTGKTVTASGLTLSGADAGNYTVATSASGAIGTINKAALTAALTGTTTKTYDGTTTAALASGNYSLTGKLGSDTVTVSGTGAYADKNAGTGKSVTASGLTLSGTDAGNYTVNASATANIGSITARAITVAADNKTKQLGTVDPALTYSFTSGNLVAGDSLTGSLVRATGENIGIYAITQGSLAASSNYTMTFTPGVFTVSNLAQGTTLKMTNKATQPTLNDGTPPSVGSTPPAPAITCTPDMDCTNLPYPTNQKISATITFGTVQP